MSEISKRTGVGVAVVGVVVALIGLVVVVGWVFRLPVLVHVRPDWVPVQFNTGLGFIGLGGGILAALAGFRRLASGLGIFVAAVGLGTLFQYVAGINLGIDELLMRHDITVATSHPGRMAPNTALCFLLAGAGVALARRFAISAVLGALAVGLGLIAFGGYLAGIEGAYGWGEMTRMAPVTAIGTIMAGCGLLVLAWERGRADGLPDWLPWAVAAGVLSLTMALWQSMSLAGTAGTYVVLVSHNITILFGVILAGAMGMMVRFMLMAGVRARSAEVTRESLRESEQMFRAISATAQDAIVMTDDRGRVSYWNPAAERIFGFSSDEAMGHSIVEMIVPVQYRQRLMKGMDHFRQSGGGDAIGKVLRLTAMRKDGSEFPIEHSVSAVRMAGRWFAVGILRDVSERKRAENLLKESENRFRAIADFSYDWDFWLGTEGGLRWVNPAVERMIGYSADECLTMKEYPLPMVDAEFRDLVRDHLTRASSGDMQNDVEFRVVCKNGALIWVGASYQPIFDNEDLFMGSRWSVRDITKRKRAEDALRDSEAVVRAVVDSSLDCIVIIDHEGRLVEFNPAAEAVFGIKRSEVIGQELAEVIIPERYRDAHRAGMARFLRTNEGVVLGRRLEMDALKSDGTEFPVELAITVISADDGPPMFAGYLRDIADRKSAERELADKTEELERSNSELQQFAYVASHDLQEPLRMVTSYMGLLSKRYADQLDEPAQEFIGYAVDGAQRMQRLIKDLLEYSRVGTRGRPFTPTDFDGVLDDALANLQTRIDETDAVITRDPMPMLFADDGQMVRLFQNLIGNALKYRKPDVDPVIHVTVAPDGDGWRFSVADNGIGIAPEYFDRIFMVFQRLHGRNEFEGTGIGLAVCRKIVERHGGRIWVESEQGRGSTFHFRLPVRSPVSDL